MTFSQYDEWVKHYFGDDAYATVVRIFTFIPFLILWALPNKIRHGQRWLEQQAIGPRALVLMEQDLKTISDKAQNFTHEPMVQK